MKPIDKKALFDTLKDNYNLYYKGETFWRELHALDADLARGGIRVEEFRPEADTPASSRDLFFPGEKTVVIQFNTREASEKGVSLLTKIFRGTGVEFGAEELHRDGQVIHQIRSNIDKAQFARLAIFCKFRFEEEIPHEEHKALRNECQQVMDEYCRKPNAWHATEGMPAFCGLMGMHGILRPELDEHYKPDAHRKYDELNAPHPHGTPLLFRRVHIHVDINRHGEITGTTPYEYGYDHTRAAVARAVEGGDENLPALQGVLKGVLSLFNEATGLNCLPRHVPLANKFLRGGIAAVTLYAVIVEGRAEPLIIAAIGGTGLLVAFARDQWKSVGSIKALEKNPQPLLDAVNALPSLDSAPSGQGMDVNSAVKTAFSPIHINHLQSLLRKANSGLGADDRIDPRIIDGITLLEPRQADDHVAANIYGAVGSIAKPRGF